MSVLIEGMKMPTKCSDCELCELVIQNGIYCCNCPVPIMQGTDITKAIKENCRHPKCPLVEVPTPHGSLIDSEEFKNMLALGVMTAQMLGSDENTSLDIHFMKEILKEMPTVIEAEE